MKSGDRELAAHPALAVLNHATAENISLWRIELLKHINKPYTVVWQMGFYNHDYKTLHFRPYVYILVLMGSPALAFGGSSEGDETTHRYECQPTRKTFPKLGLITPTRTE